MRIPLDFSPDFTPWKKTSKFQQAQWLLHEIVKNKHHDYPCDCGACIYAEYQKLKKAKGRTYSKRTFFVFFLKQGFYRSTVFDKRLKQNRFFGFNYEIRKSDNFLKRIDAGYYSKKAEDRNLEGKTKKDGEFFYSIDIAFEKIQEITRRRTLSMIKKLKENEKGRHAKVFLRGILNKKCFYEYYKRAGDPRLESIVLKIREDFSSNQGHL